MPFELIAGPTPSQIELSTYHGDADRLRSGTTLRIVATPDDLQWMQGGCWTLREPDDVTIILALLRRGFRMAVVEEPKTIAVERDNDDEEYCPDCDCNPCLCNACTRCYGEGTVPTWDYESYLGEMEKVCPKCGGTGEK